MITISTSPRLTWYKVTTRSSAIAVIANYTAYDIQYSYVQTVVWTSCGQHEHLLIYQSLLLVPVSLLADRCFVANILKQKCLKKLIGSPLLGTQQNLQPSECHNTHYHRQRWTDDSIMPCVQQYDWLKSF